MGVALSEVGEVDTNLEVEAAVGGRDGAATFEAGAFGLDAYDATGLSKGADFGKLNTGEGLRGQGAKTVGDVGSDFADSLRRRGKGKAAK